MRAFWRLHLDISLYEGPVAMRLADTICITPPNTDVTLSEKTAETQPVA
jgi:hypothetical protein